MKIITALYDNTIKPYKEMSLRMLDSLYRVGYHPSEWKVYELTKNPNEKENHKTGWYMPVFLEKLHLVKRAMAELNDDIFWVDADCLVTARLEGMTEECDFATTLRRPIIGKSSAMMFDGYTNTGIFYIRNNAAGRKMLDLWIEALNGCTYGDQEAMNKILIDYVDLSATQNAIHGGKMDSFYVFVDGIMVKLATCDEYNNFYFDETTKKAKIIHFKGTFDRRLYAFWLDKILGVKNGVS